MTDYYTCPECNGHRRYCGCKEKEKAKEMTDKQTPPDWVLLEAAKRAGHKLSPAQMRAGQIAKAVRPYFDALCDMIERYEQPPVDRKLLCAREAMAGTVLFDPVAIEGIVSRAIELWEEGFGK